MSAHPAMFVNYYSAPVGVRSIAINLSVCLSTSISLEPLDRSSHNFVCRFPVAVAQSSSGGVALRYVLPVFVNDVTFGRNGRKIGKGWHHCVDDQLPDVYECLLVVT